MLFQREAIGSGNLHERTELPGLSEADEFLVIRIKVKAIADRETLAGFLAGGDHRVALGGGNSHGLLADDVLAGTEGRYDVLGVDTGRRNDIDDIDGLIRRDLVPLLVRVDVGFVEAVEFRELHALLSGTRDHRHELHVLGLQQRRRQLAVGIVTQATEGEAERLTAGLRGAKGRSEGITSGQAANGTKEGTTSRAHRGD